MLVRSPWGGISLKDKQAGYRPWVKSPKALEEDPGMGYISGSDYRLVWEMPTTDSNDCGLTREWWWSGRCPWLLVAVSDGHDFGTVSLDSAEFLRVAMRVTIRGSSCFIRRDDVPWF